MLGKYNKEWHENGIMFFCIFTMIMSLYSAFNLSGFFVADFFKNNIISATLFSHHAFTNILTSSDGIVIAIFFTLKILLSVFTLTSKNNLKRMLTMVGLFLLYIIEGIAKVAGACFNPDGADYACGFDNIINPLASLIMITFIFTILCNQMMIFKKELDDEGEELKINK
jgi:hypothetical protein